VVLYQVKQRNTLHWHQYLVGLLHDSLFLCDIHQCSMLSLSNKNIWLSCSLVLLQTLRKNKWIGTRNLEIYGIRTSMSFKVTAIRYNCIGWRRCIQQQLYNVCDRYRKLFESPFETIPNHSFGIKVTLHIWRPSPSSATWGRAKTWWQGTHLTRLNVLHSLRLQFSTFSSPLSNVRRKGSLIYVIFHNFLEFLMRP
jgi:hypothetical protein